MLYHVLKDSVKKDLNYIKDVVPHQRNLKRANQDTGLMSAKKKGVGNRLQIR